MQKTKTESVSDYKSITYGFGKVCHRLFSGLRSWQIVGDHEVQIICCPSLESKKLLTAHFRSCDPSFTSSPTLPLRLTASHLPAGPLCHLKLFPSSELEVTLNKRGTMDFRNEKRKVKFQTLISALVRLHPMRAFLLLYYSLSLSYTHRT